MFARCWHSRGVGFVHFPALLMGHHDASLAGGALRLLGGTEDGADRPDRYLEVGVVANVAVPSRSTRDSRRATDSAGLCEAGDPESKGDGRGIWSVGQARPTRAQAVQPEAKRHRDRVVR